MGILNTQVDTTVEVRSKNWQKPKPNHPWRKYSNQIRTVDVIIEKKELISVKEFIQQLARVDWFKYEIILPSTFEGSSLHFLGTLPQEKQAAWICNILRKYYVQKF